MISGLGTYLVESGLIYFKSLLRSSLLYAAETYYDLTEKELRLIESRERYSKLFRDYHQDWLQKI